MGNVTVIGGQWGDEGKGKVIDWLADRADVVVRFQGGNNAGHTIVVGDKTYKLSLLPSGVVQGKLSIIGNGVVVDPWSLMDEIGRARAQGLEVTPDVLVLDLMMPDPDGFAVLEEIRRTPATRDLPVIIATAKDLTPEERASHLISDGLVRISAGLEDTEDLLADVEQALQAA